MEGKLSLQKCHRSSMLIIVPEQLGLQWEAPMLTSENPPTRDLHVDDVSNLDTLADNDCHCQCHYSNFF